MFLSAGSSTGVLDITMYTTTVDAIARINAFKIYLDAK